jgi:hypothetical protein
MSDRVEELRAFEALLATTAGKRLVEELRIAWDPYRLLGDTPEKTAYAVGQRDAFKFISMLQTGELINGD